MGHSEARERARQSADAALRRPNLWFGPANILYRADRARALSWQRNINVQERSSRTAAADGRLLRKVIGSNEGTGAQRIDRSRAPSARTLAVDEVAPTLGPPIKGDCGRRRPILHACKNHTSSENRSMEDTKRRRSNERPGVSQRYSQLRSVTVVADSPLRAICGGSRAIGMYLCNCAFALSRLMEQSHGPPALKGGRARRGRHWLPAIRLGSARACL